MSNDWISVKERFPTEEKGYLVTDITYDDDVEIAFWDADLKDFIGGNIYKVTHWMPVPKPPKEEKT